MGHGVRDTVRSVHINRRCQSVIPCPSVDAWKRGPGQSSERTISFDTLVRDISDIHHMLSPHNIQGMGRRFINISERLLLLFFFFSYRTCPLDTCLKFLASVSLSFTDHASPAERLLSLLHLWEVCICFALPWKTRIQMASRLHRVGHSSLFFELFFLFNVVTTGTFWVRALH